MLFTSPVIVMVAPPPVNHEITSLSPTLGCFGNTMLELMGFLFPLMVSARIIGNAFVSRHSWYIQSGPKMSIIGSSDTSGGRFTQPSITSFVAGGTFVPTIGGRFVSMTGGMFV